MPWNEVTAMSLKREFIHFALQRAEPFTTLCRRFKISTKTGYKLLKRFHEEGEIGLKEKSRRPLISPNKTSEVVEEEILNLRNKKPSWGGRKIRAYLINQGFNNLPSPSTITDVLKRNGLIKDKNTPSKAFERFEHKEPNDLWQVDFKGHFKMHRGRCHPLTVLDDYSRFSIGLRACKRETTKEVKHHFIEIFEEYGLPYRMNFDNGTPWACFRSSASRLTELSVWLIRLGISVSYSRVRRPQTNGKLERFHQTLKKELLQYHYFFGIKEAQEHFDQWRTEYNFERPHEAVALQPPSKRYQFSARKFPEKLPDIEYRTSDVVRNVDSSGKISYQNKKIFVGEGLKHLPVALREYQEGKFNIFLCDQKIISINLKDY